MGTWQPPPRLLSRARSQVVAARASGSLRKLSELARFRVAFSDFDAERSLSGGGAHDFGGDDLLDQFRFAEALQAGRGENDGVVFSLLELAQAGVDVAAQGMNVEIGADGFELRLAAQAGGTDARALRQVFNLRVVARAEGVARVLALGDRGDFESSGKFGGEIFQRVDGEIDASGGEGFFDFLGEHALGADLGEGDVGDFVAGGVDDFDFDLVSAGAQEGGDVVGLPEGKLRAAGADAEFNGVAVGGHCFVVRAARVTSLRDSYSFCSSTRRFRAGLHIPPLRGWMTGRCSELCSAKKRTAVRKYLSLLSVAPVLQGSFDSVWRIASLFARLRSG